MTHRSTIFGLAICIGLLAVDCDAQQNWPRFRGENGDGLVEAQLPTSWSSDDYLWQKELPGTGSSSPVIWNDKLFITSADAKATLILQCLDAKTGKEHWNKSFKSTAYRMHPRNSFASSTPAVDKDHVYVAMADPEHTFLIALDHNGQIQWKRDFGTWTSQHGFSMSPMIYKDKIIFVNSQQAERVRPPNPPGKSEVIAVDRQTGKDLWRTPLTATRACYALPCVVEIDGKERLIGTNTGEGFYCIDPNDGKMIWSTLPFRMRTVASTLSAGGLVVGSNGTGGGGNYLVAAKVDKNGAKKVFEITQSANYVPTPIAVGDNLFLFGDKGIGACVDLKSGDVNWRKRLAKGFSGSPVSNGSHLYVMDESGNVLVIKADKEFKQAGKVALGQNSRSTPAISENRIYFRTDSKLFCLGEK